MSSRFDLRPRSAAAAPAASAGAIERRLLTEEIVERLIAEIVAGQWAPGERVTEQSLSARFGVSRTPLREALKVVAAEGLLALTPNRGAVITEPTLDDVREKLLVLGALEALAVEQVCRHASADEIAELGQLHERAAAAHRRRSIAQYFELNDAFHRRIIELSRNATLLSVYDALSMHIKRARLIGRFREQLREASSGDHQAVLDAIARRDAAAGKRAMEGHMTAIIGALEQGSID
ncbi:MAG: GntR family transcriptional regulator [Burkholderiaceae bacterium]